MSSVTAATNPRRQPAGARTNIAPVLRATHDNIRYLAARRATSLSHIQRALEGDAAATLNLFADVNLTLKRLGRPPASDIPRAILYLGMAEFPNRFGRAEVLENVVEAQWVEPCVEALRHAHLVSRQARAIGALAGGINLDELLATALTRSGLQFIERLAQHPKSSLDLAAFQSCLPVPDANETDDVTNSCFEIAQQIAVTVEHNWDEEKLEPLYRRVADICARDAEQIARSLRLATIDAARSGSHFGVYPAVAHLMSPGVWPATTKPAPAKTKAAGANRPAQREAPRRQPNERPPERPAVAPINPAERNTAARNRNRSGQAQQGHQAAIGSLNRAIAAGAGGAKILPLALQALCDGAELDVAMLLMIEKSSGRLVVRAHRGKKLPEQFLAGSIKPAQNPLLAKLLKAEAAFHWQSGKHHGGLEPLLLRLLGRHDAFFYALVIDGKPLGVMIGARPRASTNSAAERFKICKQIGGATMKALNPGARPASKSA